MGRTVALALAIMACFASATFAGVSVTTNGKTTEGVAFPIGTRAIGMGGAFIAVSDDATAPFWNPAGLSRVPHFQTTLEVGADVSEFDVDQDDIETIADTLSGDINTPAGYLDLEDILAEFGHVVAGSSDRELNLELRVGTGVSFAMRGVAISAFGDGGGEAALTQLGGSGEPISANGHAVGFFGPAVSASRMLKGNTAVGVTVRSVRATGYGATPYTIDSLGQTANGKGDSADDSNFAVDIGVLRTTKEGLSVGAVLRNVNSPSFDLNLPTVPMTMAAKLDWSLDVGVAAREGNLLLAWDLANIGKSGAAQVNMGLEYKPIKYVALRAGMMDGDYTLGAGLQLGPLGVEVASGERIKSMAAAGLRTMW
jgi:hypothetical protein